MALTRPKRRFDSFLTHSAGVAKSGNSGGLKILSHRGPQVQILSPAFGHIAQSGQSTRLLTELSGVQIPLCPLMENEELKQECKEWFLEGYKESRNVEEVQNITLKAAESKFERMWNNVHD